MTTIEQIVAVGDNQNAELGIFGLGDDSKVYVWDRFTGEWKLFMVSKTTEAPF